MVRNILRMDEPSLFADLFRIEDSKRLKQLPETSLLILVADDEAGDDQKQTRLVKMAGEWEKVVKTVGGLTCKFEVPSDSIADRLRTEAKDAGKTLSLQGATLLKDMCGESYSRAAEELSKLIVYAGDSPNITEHHVKEVVFGSREWNIFKLTDAVLKRNPGDALRQLTILVGSNRKVEDVAFSSIFPQMSRQFRLLYQARFLIENKADPSSVPQSLRDLLPSKGNLLSEKDFPKKLAMQGARHLSFEQIGHCLNLLADTDARLKGALPSHSCRETMERMVLQMIAAVEPRRAS